jgi:hypothetical protein
MHVRSLMPELGGGALAAIGGIIIMEGLRVLIADVLVGLLPNIGMGDKGGGAQGPP